MEDWAEIRRLHRAEGFSIRMIARTLGISRTTVRSALTAEGPPRYVRTPAGSAVDAFETRIREQLRAVADDAGHGDRRAGRLDAGDDGVQGAGRRAAAGLPAAGPDLADQLRGRRHRAVRLLVPADHAAGGFWADPTPDAAAGADDGDRLLPLAIGGAGSHPRSRGPVRRLVAADPRTRRGAADPGLGRRDSGRPQPRRPDRAHRRLPSVPRCPRGQGDRAQTPQTRAQGHPRRQSSSAPTTTWSARFYPAAPSPGRRTSTPSCRTGW